MLEENIHHAGAGPSFPQSSSNGAACLLCRGLILAYVVRAAVPRANTAAWLFMLFAVVMPGLFRSGVFVRVGTYDEIKN